VLAFRAPHALEAWTKSQPTAPPVRRSATAPRSDGTEIEADLIHAPKAMRCKEEAETMTAA
jgi:hypothetical protein